MSLVIAIRLGNNDVLFAADKRTTLTKGVQILGTNDDALKLHKIAGGIMGFAGDSDLARGILEALPDIPGDTPNLESELQQHILTAYHRRTMLMPKPVQEEKELSFLFGNRSDSKFYAFTHSSGFSPYPIFEKWASIGIDTVAILVLTLYGKQSYSLEDAMRLAALQVTRTSLTDPTYVSGKMDMWLLRDNQDDPEVVNPTEIDRVVSAAEKHLLVARREFFK